MARCVAFEHQLLVDAYDFRLRQVSDIWAAKLIFANLTDIKQLKEESVRIGFNIERAEECQH